MNIGTIGWNAHLQRYVALYSAPLSQDAVMRTAMAPEGPWSRPVKAFAARRPVSGNVYDAQAHPQHDAGGGRTIYVSYSRSTGPFSSEVRIVVVTLAPAAPRRP